MTAAVGTTLETKRLILRLPLADDVPELAEMHADPDVMRYLMITRTVDRPTTGARNPVDLVAAWRTTALLLGHWQLLGYGQWVVVEKQSSRIVGRTGLWHSPDWPGLELSWMTSRGHWGKGFATEAALAARDYAFTVVGADRVISLIHPENAASIRVALKLGERFEREHSLEGHTSHLYGVNKSDI